MARVVCPACGGTTAAGCYCRRCGTDLSAPEPWRDSTDPLPPAVPPVARASRRRRWGIALAGVGLVLALGGIGVVGYAIGHARGDRAAAPSSAPTSAPAPTPARLGIVEVAPALASRPETAAVTGVLSAYFTAINDRDYPAYRATLVDRPGLAQTEAEFLRRYRTTRDGGVQLLGLDAGPDGSWTASVAFTSRQDPADAPDGTSACLRWSIPFRLVPAAEGLRIDTALPATTRHRPC